MKKSLDYLLPTIAVFLVAVFMHIVRTKTVEPKLILLLMLVYMAGMVSGAVVYTLKKESYSF